MTYGRNAMTVNMYYTVLYYFLASTELCATRGVTIALILLSLLLYVPIVAGLIASYCCSGQPSVVGMSLVVSATVVCLQGTYIHVHQWLILDILHWSPLTYEIQGASYKCMGFQALINLCHLQIWQR